MRETIDWVKLRRRRQLIDAGRSSVHFSAAVVLMTAVRSPGLRAVGAG
jgi:hypothetical protein